MTKILFQNLIDLSYFNLSFPKFTFKNKHSLIFFLIFWFRLSDKNDYGIFNTHFT